MAQNLGEQLMTVERALGERMIESALVILRSWLNEIGENNPYEEAHASIRKQYDALFSRWLTSDDEEIEDQMNSLTGDTFQLVDAVYADLRVKRGLSPDMHGFNPDSPQSVLNYFLNCVRLRHEDIEWLHHVMNDKDKTTIALMAFSALSHNLRECFSIDAFLTLIDGMNAENEVLAIQCVSSVLMLLMQYDVRIDFFPQIQEAFGEAMREKNDGGEEMVRVLCTLIRVLLRPNVQEPDVERKAFTLDQLPEAIEHILQEAENEPEKTAMVQWYPSSESEYFTDLLTIMPDTWVYNELTEGNPNYVQAIDQALLQNGFRGLLWDHPEMAEDIYRKKLRKGSKDPLDYIDYAHCMMLKGDRMMAFEYYRQARGMCKNVKEFYSLFRPDRGALVEKGVPLEHVYLIEDQLLTV